MVGGDAATDAVTRARTMPGLGVGLHIVLVEGRPILPPAKLSDLVEKDGSFRGDMAWLGAEIFFRPSVRAQVRAEPPRPPGLTKRLPMRCFWSRARTRSRARVTCLPFGWS